MNPLRKLEQFGQSVWYDNIHRGMFKSGELARMVSEDGLKGVTSNPSIFEKAIGGGSDYDTGLAQLLSAQPQLKTRDLFFALAIEDIQGAADILRPVYDKSNGRDGYVSLEVSPDLAYDSQGTIQEAKRLAAAVQRPNLMIKVPATKEGLPAIEALIADGIHVNVTLLFSVERYKEVVEAYILGLEKRLRKGQPIHNIASVASFFVSRVDTAVDKLLEQHMAQARDAQKQTMAAMLGKIAVANAKLAYAWYKDVYRSSRFAKLIIAGANTQRLLWASTGSKNPNYSDVLYIDTLIGAETVNTIPPATYQSFKDHGKPVASLEQNLDLARDQVARLRELGIDLPQVTQQLEDEGVELFAKAFKSLLAIIDNKVKTVSPAAQRAAS